MAKVAEHRNFTVVELAEGISVRTSVASINHSALRSGFAGYPANPRWGATKFCAWRMGKQWREALDRGDMVVRPVDLILVPASEMRSQPEPFSEPKPKRPSLLAQTKRFLTHQLA